MDSEYAFIGTLDVEENVRNEIEGLMYDGGEISVYASVNGHDYHVADIIKRDGVPGDLFKSVVSDIMNAYFDKQNATRNQTTF